MAESDIVDLSRRIYQQHRQALDLILEHRPDRLGEIRRVVDGLVKQSAPAVRFNWSSKAYIQFATPALDNQALHVPKATDQSERLLLFWFGNQPEGLHLTLYIQPGPDELRYQLYAMAKTHRPLFSPGGKLRQRWHPIYRRPYLNQNDLGTPTLDELEQKIHETWDNFLRHDLSDIEAAVTAEVARWPALGMPSANAPVASDPSMVKDI